MAWPIGSKVALERVTSRVGLRSYVLCWRPLSSNPCAAGEFVKVEGVGRSGQARRGEAEMSALPGSDVLLTKAMQDDTNFTMRLLDPREAVMRGSRFQPTRSESKFVCISEVQTVGSEDHQPA